MDLWDLVEKGNDEYEREVKLKELQKRDAKALYQI